MEKFDRLMQKALFETIDAKDYESRYLISKSRHWIGVYKILVEEYNIIHEGDFNGFEAYINSLFYYAGRTPRVKINGDDLRRLYNEKDVFRHHSSTWIEYNTSFSLSIFSHYLNVLHYFSQSLSRLRQKAQTRRQLRSF